MAQAPPPPSGPASPPRSRALRPVLLEGDLLAGRYRLVRPVPADSGSAAPGDDGPAVLWLAHDEVLARPVAAKVLPAGGRRGAASGRTFLDAAATGGAVSHPCLARVYDAAVEVRRAQRSGHAAGEIDVAYVVSEWVDGPTLVQRLTAEGPYDAVDAVDLAVDLAEGLAAAHAQGLVHGRVHPGNVLLTAGGATKLTDLGVSSSLPQRAVPALRATDPDGAAADVRDLAAVTYALLTGRWPTTATPQPAAGLPAAPAGRESGRSRGQLSSPRQVRAGVPRSLDAVVVRALDPVRATEAPPLTTPRGLAAALAGAVAADTARLTARTAPTAPRRRPVPRWVRRAVPLAVLAAVLTALGLAAYAKGLEIGTLQGDEQTLLGPAAPGPGPRAAPRAPVPLTGAVVVRDFDPPPGDGTEGRGSVPNATDDDLTTAWRTERYVGEGFSGRKAGVGLLVGLAAPTQVARVDLALETDGTVVELRVGDAEAGDASGYRLVASGRSEGGLLSLAVPPGTRARYYLLWVTGLPRVDDRFVAGVRELRLFQP